MTKKYLTGGLFYGKGQKPQPLTYRKSIWQNLKPEEQIQIAFFNWLRDNEEKFPVLKLAFHPANGFFVSETVAKKQKAMGVRAGVVDFILLAPSATGRHSALVFDFKTDAKYLSPAQKAWLKVLAEFHPTALILPKQTSPKAAAQEVATYLNLPIDRFPAF
jgi:hypothetical protein